MLTPRRLLFAIACFSFAVVGIALYLQHYKDMLPCPWCVIQRYMFIFVGLCCLIGAVINKPRGAAMLALLPALGGLAAVGKHLWILSHPGMSCGIDPVATFANKMPTASVLPWLFQADGLCEDARDLLFGLSIPQWSAVSFVALSAALVFVLARRRAR